MPSLRVKLASAVVALSSAIACSGPRAAPPTPSELEKSVIIDHEVKTIDGKATRLSDYRGKVLLIVNVASKCGYTPQYDGLEALYQRYKDRGLVVLGFPSNEYGGQEPGSNEEIANFCRMDYGVTFPMFEKVVTKGPGIAPLYRALTEETAPSIRGEISWNFNKFLVDKVGHVTLRLPSKVKPLDAELTAAVEQLLGS